MRIKRKDKNWYVSDGYGVVLWRKLEDAEQSEGWCMN